MDSIRHERLGVASAPQKAQIRQAHMNRMPLELLVKIFKFDLGALNSPRKLRSGARLSRIISLSSVCSRWRTAALETSSFWTFIPLHLDNDLVTACVARAGNKLLEVVGVDHDIPTASDHDKPWPCEDALGDHAHKIHSLTLVTHTLHRIHPVIRWTLEPTVPCLQELSVTLTMRPTSAHRGNASLFESESESESQIDALTKQLHTLSLKRIYVSWMERSFDKLRVLKLNSINILLVDDLRRIAATCPMLEVLELTSVELSGTRTGLQAAWKLLVFPNLQTLRLSYSHSFRSYGYVFSKGRHRTELVVDTFGLGSGSGLLNFALFWRSMGDMKETLDNLGRITLLGIGRNTWSRITRDNLFRTVVQMLPDLVTLRFEKIELGRAALTEILDAMRWTQKIKTVQMKCVGVTDTKAFEYMIDHMPCGTQRLELTECWYVEDDTNTPITPRTLSHEPSSQSALKIVFLER